MTEEEAKLGQRFKIDVVVELNDQVAYETDDAENTVNYVEIYSLVQSIFENQRFNLIEACANAIASKLLEEFSAIESATVTVKKPSVPVEMYLRVFRRGGYTMPLKSRLYWPWVEYGRSCGPFKNGRFFARKHERTRRDTK